MSIAESRLIKERLAKELASRTREKFKCVPSHHQFASHFYASSKYSLKVSGEAVRNWFKGESFPDLDYLTHLIEWLNLDMNNVFLNKSGENPSENDLVQQRTFITAEHYELALKIIQLIEKDKNNI